MLNIPIEFATLMFAFAPLFSQRIFSSVQVLVVGAILAPGKRTITSLLRVMGLSLELHFQNYHRAALPRRLVKSCCQSRSVTDAGECLCPTRATGDGFGRYH